MHPFIFLQTINFLIRTRTFAFVITLLLVWFDRVKLAGCKSALTPFPTSHPHPAVVYSTDRSEAVVPVLVLLFVASWFILRGDLL